MDLCQTAQAEYRNRESQTGPLLIPDSLYRLIKIPSHQTQETISLRRVEKQSYMLHDKTVSFKTSLIVFIYTKKPSNNQEKQS